jgi:hypothetical protein
MMLGRAGRADVQGLDTTRERGREDEEGDPNRAAGSSPSSPSSAPSPEEGFLPGRGAMGREDGLRAEGRKDAVGAGDDE